MFFRIIQYIGLLVIILFSATSVFLTTTEREFKMYGRDSFLYTYASFFEDRFFDLRMKMTSNFDYLDKNIVLAAIDDHSLNKIGRWPWTRTKHAKLIDKLGSFGAKILAFDIFYSEPEMACNMESPDKALISSIKKFQLKPGNKVILPYAVEEMAPNEKIDEEKYFKEAPDQLLNFMLTTENAKGANLQANLVSRKVFPIPELANGDIGIAHIEANADSDGVFRHYPLVTNVDSNYYPSFALLTYQLYTDDKIKVVVNSVEGSTLVMKNASAYTNSQGETKVRWLGGRANFPTVSAFDIFNAKDSDPEMTKIFKDKIVFLASTAFGAHDLRNTPLDSALPGVYFHMNMTKMLLEGKFYISEEESINVSWILLFVGTLIIIGVMLLGHPMLDFVAVNVIIATVLLLDTYYFIPHGYNVRLFFCMFSVVVCYSWSTFLHFHQSNKEKAKIRGTFSRYLAPSIVNDLLKNPEKVKLGGEKKNITVFFSDVRDFTSISEKLTPEQLGYVINKYMTMMTDTLFEHNGTLDKYIGDAMVAYWGAPVDIENHPYWAIKGAIAMIERLPLINEEFKKEGFPEFRHGIGLNTGDCSVGNMGSNQIFSYTALGDSMNLGARLESLCKFYGVQLNVSEYTKNAIPANLRKEFVFRTLDKVKVKGKVNAVTIYEIIHPSHHLAKDTKTLDDYEIAFKNYLNKNFKEARDILHDLNKKYPDDKTFKRMHDICDEFNTNPPPADWDGSYTHKTK